MFVILQVKNIEQKYQAKNGEITALENISFSLEKGQFMSIVGPSGCGKSTLLSIIAGLIKPSSGEVLVGGNKIEGVSQQIGYMLQKDNLLEWRNIYQNIIFGLEIRGMMSAEKINRALSLLETYGLAEFKYKYPSQLSGGMRQRAALIRTLAVNPEILLLDEAFSALDYQTRLTVTDDVHRILKQENKTALIVSHDIPESISMGDKVMVLTGRPAHIKEILEIKFDMDNPTPLSCRNSPQFSGYFNRIWKELQSDE
ncbi:MAG: ABC transporter ATP-binding protein [Oscillospiraceae bacterium]